MFKPKFDFEVPEFLQEFENFDDGLVRVDQDPNQEFNYNVHHYIRNDIAKILDLQNNQAFAVAIENLNELPTNSNIPSDLSESEQIRYIVNPRLQDPVDIQRIIDYKYQLEAERLKSEYEKSQASNLDVSADESNVDGNVEPNEGAS